MIPCINQCICLGLQNRNTHKYTNVRLCILQTNRALQRNPPCNSPAACTSHLLLLPATRYKRALLQRTIEKREGKKKKKKKKGSSAMAQRPHAPPRALLRPLIANTSVPCTGRGRTKSALIHPCRKTRQGTHTHPALFFYWYGVQGANAAG